MSVHLHPSRTTSIRIEGSPVTITGDKSRIVNRVQYYLDDFFSQTRRCDYFRSKLETLQAQNVQLADIPVHEARIQTALSEYNKATEDLQFSARRIQDKTDPDHIHKYTRGRYHSGLMRYCVEKYHYIHLAHKEILEAVHTAAKTISETDYATQITQARNASQTKAQEAQTAIERLRREEKAVLEYSLIDLTFPSCSDRLNRENPAEYLRQSILYQNKLLQKQDAATALAFGKSWIKGLPKEATWEQVENMSFLMVEAADKTDNPNLAEYRASVEQWLREHPLPGNPDTASLSPAQATDPVGRRTYVLGLLYLKGKLDLSPEAFQLYQNCSCLYPDQLAWKAAQAYYYCSKRQITEAEQLLANLPKDDPSVANAQTYLSKTQLASKVDQVYERISHHQLTEADQLIADLPQNDPSVKQAQIALNARRSLNQKIDQVYAHMSYGQLQEAEQLLAELPPEDLSVIEAKKNLDVEWNIYHKVSQAGEHISQQEWKEVEQLLAGLPQDHPLVMQAQKILADHRHAWYVASTVQHVANHVSNLQWLEAEQLLAELPQEDSLVIGAKERFAHALNKRILRSGFDLGTLAFFRLVPFSFRETLTFDAAQTGIQLLSYEPARSIWTSLLLRTSQPSIDVPLRTGLMMIGDVVDCFFRNMNALKRFQGIENLTSSSLRAFNTVCTLYSHPEQRSTLSFMNLGNSLISTIQTIDEMRGIHRSAPTQAIFSTLQKVASDVFAASTITSQADLLPLFRARTHSLARRMGLNILAALTVSSAPQETQEDSKEEWFLAAIGIGSIAAYRFCFDYPYLWASSVMKEAEWCFSQGKYDEAKQTLIESENVYLVSRARPAVQAYANYVTWLIDNPRFLENPVAYEEFLTRLNFALAALNKIAYYKGVRNNLLLKKAEVAIRKQNPEMLSEVVKEKPANQIIKHGFNYFLSHAFHLALTDAAQALTFLKVMGPSFPSRLHPITDSLHRLIQDQTTALQNWSALNSFSLMLKPPSPKKVEQWNDAFRKLQSFFSKNIGKTEIYQELQAYKLMISFAQGGDTEQTEALFKQSNVEAQERFSQVLILLTKLLRKAGIPKDAINLLKRVNFNSFKDNELIQNYCRFFSLLYSPPLGRDALLKQIQALEKLLACLKEKYEEQRIFFSACRIVLHLDAGESAKAKDLFEKADSKVSTEATSLLFERMYVSQQESGDEKALSHLKSIETLGPWQHQGLFQAFQAYLLCEQSSPEVYLHHLTAVIAQLNGIEQLSHFADSLQLQRYFPEFQLRLSQGKFQEAKDVLNRKMPDELYDQLCKFLFKHLIKHGEQLRQETTLRNATETLKRLKELFSARDAGRIQNYVNFLIVLENLPESREIATHQKARQLLNTIFSQLASIRCPIFESLQREMINILSKIAPLAKEAGQLRTALEAYELIKRLGIEDGYLNQSIQRLKEQLLSR